MDFFTFYNYLLDLIQTSLGCIQVFLTYKMYKITSKKEEESTATISII